MPKPEHRVSELLRVRPAEGCRWDLVALGEVMLRLDPGDERISTTRNFRVWEGGGEYNVARALRRVFGQRTAIVTALADNPVGRLVEDLILQGGVDQSYLRWMPYDGIGRSVRNGLNFTERGFGVRGAVGCSDRGNTAVAALRPGEVDWERIFVADGCRWFHCGGIFAGLSETTGDVAAEAMEAARSAGVVVSYDLNFRPSLWSGIGGRERAATVNRKLVGLVDVLFGNEEDFGAALGYDIGHESESFVDLDTGRYSAMLAEVAGDYPGIKLVATSLREVVSASRNRWGGICFADGAMTTSRTYDDLEILDRVGGGDSFASGFIHGLLAGFETDRALELAVAHGALAMTTPGDTSMVTRAEVERLAGGASARVVR